MSRRKKRGERCGGMSHKVVGMEAKERMEKKRK
jgi:hypothetical protein